MVSPSRLALIAKGVAVEHLTALSAYSQLDESALLALVNIHGPEVAADLHTLPPLALCQKWGPGVLTELVPVFGRTTPSPLREE